ncbi:MAG TPA: hypothetical protein VFV67_12095 [Actinophytocola sp.]|uniref:hypothetical protein n=1 Tax=Actinophytocola sp. TaxID=1872138 RepID=UPI002DBFC129|nr:hypothetical protein [Actinophytocola sp.]HEU5471387.1 hypothetical protein [Actinophytocola sp.]
MRLVRLGDGASEVGVDVRAALASWGRGDAVVGGIALTGCQPPGCPRPVEAIVVVPRGILVVVGIDLPDPAVRLDAPLSGQWKTDGWPLVRGDGMVNPGAEALEAAEAISARLERARAEQLPVGTVIAVGPYVSQVVQPTSDLLRGVRILHPEPMTLLGATRELAVYSGTCTVDGAQRVISALSPDTTVDPADLIAEGFVNAAFPTLNVATTTLIPRVRDPAPPAGRRPTAPLRPGARSPHPLRWLPVGAAILVALLMITGVVLAVTSSAGSDSETAAPANRGQPAGTPPTGITIGGVAFQPKGDSRTADCASHAYGDLQAWLRNGRCSELIRQRFESTVDQQRAAVLVAVLRFTDPASATELRTVADRPGSGAVTDQSVEGTAWPDGAKPLFESAAYASGREGNSVRLVQAVWIDQQSTPENPALRDLATKALQLPAPG